MKRKRCSKCGKVKAASEFYKHKRYKDGLRSQCKLCMAEYDRKYYVENREAIRQYQIENREAKAEYDCARRAENRDAMIEKDRRYYAENREACIERSRKWYAENSEKAAETNHRYYINNKEKVAEYNREYYAENRDDLHAQRIAYRARSYAARGCDYTMPKHIAGRREVWGNKCYICGKDAEEMDHVKPLSAGGAHWPCNLRPICKSCNSSKGAKWPYESVVRILEATT